MSLYYENRKGKIILMLLGAIILIATLQYSNYLASNLKKNEEKNIFIFTEALQRQVSNAQYIPDASAAEGEYSDFLVTIVNTFPLPVVYEDEKGELTGQNFTPEQRNYDNEFLESKKMEFLSSGKQPIKGQDYFTYTYYFNSPLLNYIKWFPVVQGLLVGLYIALGYFLFSSSRKAEQNRVWAGMAKETAHQLGTPISAIIGWIEYLRDRFSDNEEQMEVLRELNKDVERLELVADRFSKIGSDPVLQDADIFEELLEVRDYLQRRASRKVVFDFQPPESPIHANINKHLFAWVIENLIRNSLDAMDGKGTIGCRVYRQNNDVCIDLSDTGHGIAAHTFKSVFKPGYSTKKRGWGLGLSLAKRIIEEYHKGKIYVKSSRPHEETIFSIVLPIDG
jgi:C4-dicarboxylate-specific signal transduction histidine kinase